jgi:hypothetical protein
LINELEAPDISSQTLDVEQVQIIEVLEPAQLNVKFDLVSYIDRVLAIDRFLGRRGWRRNSGRVEVSLG